MFGERAIDDDNERRSRGVVGRREVAASNDGYSLRLEVVAHQLAYPSQIQPGPLGRKVTLWGEGGTAILSGCGQRRSDSFGLHAGQLLKPEAQRRVECINGGLSGVLLTRKAVCLLYTSRCV